MQTPIRPVALEALIEHADQFAPEQAVQEVYEILVKRERRFAGIVSEGRLVGVVSQRVLAELLSRQFGHALFDRKPVLELAARDALVVTSDTPLTEVLRSVSEREEGVFFDDLALVTPEQHYLGMLPMTRLMRLQTGLLLSNLSEVEAQRTELALRNRRMTEDLRMAREVQLSLMPSGVLDFRGTLGVLELQPSYHAAELMGGDFYAVWELAPGRVACILCDVMGHGVRSALVAAVLKGLIDQHRALALDPGAFLTQLDLGLNPILSSVGERLFVTAAALCVDLNFGELAYAQAGHHPPLLLRAGQTQASELVVLEEAMGPALGLCPGLAFGLQREALRPGDTLLLYTDGLVEIAAGDGEQYGVGRLAPAFARAVRETPASIPEALVAEAGRFGAGQGFSDDTCVLAFRIHPRVTAHSYGRASMVAPMSAGAPWKTVEVASASTPVTA